MGTTDLGAPVTAVWTGAPAGGTYAVALTRPDGTIFTPPAVTTGPPTAVTFTPDMVGRWLVRWTSTVKPGAYSDIVDVWPSDPRFIISLPDAMNALGLTTTDPAQIDDLRLYIAAATPVIEGIIGPVVTQTITQTVDGNVWAIPLWQKPLAITSITEVGVTITEYVVDYSAGLVYAGKTFARRRWQPGSQTVVITYTTAPNALAQNIRLAARELVRHWWQIGKQGTRPLNGNLPVSGEAWAPSGFAVPRRVIELLQPAEQIGGFA